MNKRKRAPSGPVWHPRYWLMWQAMGLLFICAKLSYRAQLKVGQFFGNIAYYCMPRRRHIAAVNICLCFPSLSEREQQVLVKQHFRSLGIGILEVGMAWYWKPEALRKLITFEGVEHLDNALKQNRGILLLSAHFTTLELALCLLAQHYPVNMLYRKQTNPVFNDLIEKYRRLHHIGLVERRDVRTTVKLLKDKKIVQYSVDQDHGSKGSLFIPFLGVPAATVTGITRIATMGNALVVPVFYHRCEKTHRYRIVFYPALDNFPSGNDAADLTGINDLIGQAVQESPEQYFWLHRRFKTRPPGEPSVY